MLNVDYNWGPGMVKCVGPTRCLTRPCWPVFTTRIAAWLCALSHLSVRLYVVQQLSKALTTKSALDAGTSSQSTGQIRIYRRWVKAGVMAAKTPKRGWSAFDD